MPLSSRKIPLFVVCSDTFPIGPMHRHLREITAIFSARQQGCSGFAGRLVVPENSESRLIYDGQGGRHYCLYGYDRQFDPPMASRGDDNIIVCRSGFSLTPRFQGRRFTSPGARARAETLK